MEDKQVSLKQVLDEIARWVGYLDEDMIYRIQTGLKRLPSAQPERCEYYALCRHGRDENKLRSVLGVCEYCNEDADGFVTPLEKNGHAFVRFGMDGWELSLRANRWHGSAKIRYCPMCGRDLLVKLGRKDEVNRNDNLRIPRNW